MKRSDCKSLKQKTARRRPVSGCEICGWTAPESLTLKRPLLHLHHIIPVACGGTDTDANLVFICPNHHAVIHRAWYAARGGKYHGPVNRDELLVWIKSIEADPWGIERARTVGFPR